MDVNKILEMLEREDKPFNQAKRPQVAKESLIKACGGDYDDINRLLEEDIAIDDREYQPTEKVVKFSKKSCNKNPAKECDATPIGLDSLISSPTRKKATEDDLAKRMLKSLDAAEEELITTNDKSVFPEDIDFDEKAFAELFKLNADDISAMYVEEEDNIPEHLEIRFKEGNNEVLLKLMDDGSLVEEVNAEIVEEPRFSASIEQDDEGKFVLLISDATATVEPEAPMSEEDTEGIDEDDLDSTKEFVEGAGLDLDSEYADLHDIKPAKDATTKIKDPAVLPVNN